jgi:hypothetical protein
MPMLSSSSAPAPVSVSSGGAAAIDPLELLPPELGSAAPVRSLPAGFHGCLYGRSCVRRARRRVCSASMQGMAASSARSRGCLVNAELGRGDAVICSEPLCVVVLRARGRVSRTAAAVPAWPAAGF